MERTLSDVVKDDHKGTARLTPADRFGMALQIANALEYLYSKRAKDNGQGQVIRVEERVLHRDLKPANILLNAGTRVVQLADFGLSRAYETLAPATTVGVGTLYYAPEVRSGDTYDDKAAVSSADRKTCSRAGCQTLARSRTQTIRLRNCSLT
jgi:serine/threonine protein kinase